MYVNSEQACMCMPVFLNRRAAARYRTLTLIIPGPRLIKKNLPGRGLTTVENHWSMPLSEKE
jgi:hypothetical protein